MAAAVVFLGGDESPTGLAVADEKLFVGGSEALRVFDADAIDDWLDHHPLLTHHIRDQRLHDLTTAVGHGDTNAIPHAVARARKAGASWSAITPALQAGGWPHGRTWAYRIYKDTQA